MFPSSSPKPSWQETSDGQPARKSKRKSSVGRILTALLVCACVFAFSANEAMAQRGGGGRGGGGGASRGSGGGGGGHGGRTAQSSVSGGNRSASSASRSGNTANRSGNTSNRNSGNVNSGNRNTNVNNSSRTTNVGSNNNVNIDRGDVNIDVDGGYGCCRNGVRYPVAAGMAIGAVAGMTAAAIGSYYYALPPSGCVTVVRAGANYYQCGAAWYQQSMNGDQVVYVSVNP
jgi:hypothetical protein